MFHFSRCYRLWVSKKKGSMLCSYPARDILKVYWKLGTRFEELQMIIILFMVVLVIQAPA